MYVAVELRITNESKNLVHLKHAKLEAGEFSERLPQSIAPNDTIFIKVRSMFVADIPQLTQDLSL